VLEDGLESGGCVWVGGDEVNTRRMDRELELAGAFSKRKD
jgi:hypothetical protein